MCSRTCEPVLEFKKTEHVEFGVDDESQQADHCDKREGFGDTGHKVFEFGKAKRDEKANETGRDCDEEIFE